MKNGENRSPLFSIAFSDPTADTQIYNKHMIFPAPGVDLSNVDDFASIGMTVTGMPALNSITSVVAAPPGVITSADLPLRGFAGRFNS